jgi:hypothetical protein
VARGARNPDDPVRAGVVDATESRQPITVELLYSDQLGRQRTISRFGLIQVKDMWLVNLNRHWYLDWEGPRPETLTLAAADVMMQDREAALQARAVLEGEQLLADAPAPGDPEDPGSEMQESDSGGLDDHA